jgi:hypothetical protein
LNGQQGRFDKNKLMGMLPAIDERSEEGSEMSQNEF